MLAIRLQRTGRKGLAQFRLIVQDSRRSPHSGNIVERLGSYDPHTKVFVVDKEKVNHFLEHGAQPSPRVAYLLQKEGVKLPDWVNIDTDKKRTIKHTEKMRRNRPAGEPEPVKPAEAEAKDEAVTEELKTGDVPAEVKADKEEAVADTPTEETPSTEVAEANEPVEEQKTEVATEEVPAEVSGEETKA